MGAQGVPHLLETTVVVLKQLGAIQVDSTPGESLLDQRIREVRLTPAGEDFYDQSTLPSTPTEDQIDYWYQPWTNSLTTERPHRSARPDAQFAFDEAALRPGDASSLVRHELETNPPRFLRKDSRILDVQAVTDQSVHWRTIEVSVDVSPEGYLDLNTQNQQIQSWLQNLAPTFINEAFLGALARQDAAPVPQLPKEALAEAKNLALATSAPDDDRRCIWLPGTGPSGLTIELHPGTDTASSTGGASAQASVACPRPNSFPPELINIAVENQGPIQARIAGSVPLTWSNAPRDFHVIADLDEAGADRYWELISDDIAASLVASPDVRVWTVPLHWGSDLPIDSLNDRLRPLPLPELLEQASSFLDAVTGAELALDDKQAEHVTQILAARIDDTDNTTQLSVAAISEWLTYITRLLGQPKPPTNLTRALLTKSAGPTSAIEVRQLLALEPEPSQLPPRLLGTDVLSALLAHLWDHPDEVLPTGGLDTLAPLEAYRKVQHHLDETLSRRNADLGATQGRILATKAIGEALRSVDRWLAAIHDPDLLSAVGETLPPSLEDFRQHLQDWRDAATNALAPALESGKAALVFDTNTLIDHPEAIREVKQSQVVVIPNRVIQELDGLKRNNDESTAQRARAAIRSIDQISDSDPPLFENARGNLIPPDFGETEDADNQILSVAIAFSGNDVTLVTSDKNLRSKATASGIDAKAWPKLQRAGGANK